MRLFAFKISCFPILKSGYSDHRHQTNYSTPNNLSFYSLNKADVTDTEMEHIIADIVDGLFAICVTLGKRMILTCLT